jgi:hypothetical protein
MKMECDSENFWFTPLLKSKRSPSNSSGFSDTARRTHTRACERARHRFCTRALRCGARGAHKRGGQLVGRARGAPARAQAQRPHACVTRAWRSAARVLAACGACVRSKAGFRAACWL